MIENWKEIKELNHNGLKSTQPITTLNFDSYEELLWAGNQNGGVFSTYLSNEAIACRYTSFLTCKQAPIAGIVIDDEGVFSAGGSEISLRSRQGIIKWKAYYANGRIICLSSVSESRKLVFSSSEGRLAVIDSAVGRLTTEIETTRKLLNIKRGRFLCCSTDGGLVELRDTQRLSVEMSFKGGGVILDLDISGNTLITTGYTMPTYIPPSSYAPEQFIRAFDIRTGKELPQIPFIPGAQVVRFHPRFSSTIFAVSQTGSFQFLDISVTTPNLTLYQVGVQGPLTTAAISKSGDVLAFGDYSGTVTLWTDTSHAIMNDFSRNTHFCDPPNMNVPYSGNPRCNVNNHKLLSDWPIDVPITLGYKPLPISREVVKNMKMIDFIGYCKSNSEFKSNQSLALSKMARNVDPLQPKFHSQVTKTETKQFIKNSENVLYSKLKSHIDTYYDSSIPQAFRKVEIKYSRFGVEDFDFGMFNNSTYCGLETNIENCYSNALLQALFFTYHLRCAMYYHMCTDCRASLCLSCELGFLFKMLESSNSGNCHATNFLRALKNIPHARALGLLESELDSPDQDISYHTLIRNLTRFLLEKLNQECKPISGTIFKTHSQTSEERSAISRIYGSEFLTTVDSAHEEQSKKVGYSFLIELLETSDDGIPKFTELLCKNINKRVSLKAWCEKCGKYHHTNQTREMVSLPNILLVSTGDILSKYTLDNTEKETNEQKNNSTWIPSILTMEIKEDGSLQIMELEKGQLATTLKPTNALRFGVYELMATISEVKHSTLTAHLVTEVNTNSLNYNKSSDQDWHVFNDFMVNQTTEDNARNIYSWKIPAVIQYVRTDIFDTLEIQCYTNKYDDEILSQECLLNRRRDIVRKGPFKLLGKDELPIKKGMLCALDAEFVSLEKEQTEIRSDGTRSMIRPTRLSLARVSVIRGEGADEGIPFIDEYIATSEVISDHLTKFSGIKPGDLYISKSDKPLVSLKSAYKKLRFLVDAGCIFVGHGLKKDFRTINILVPPEQVCDTVDIFFLSDRLRRLSLKFLAWYLLHVDIQQYTHDSVEDAQVALKLYKKYLELVDNNEYKKTLNEIYEEGKKYKYKPPITTSGASNAQDD